MEVVNLFFFKKAFNNQNLQKYTYHEIKYISDRLSYFVIMKQFYFSKIRNIFC